MDEQNHAPEQDILTEVELPESLLEQIAGGATMSFEEFAASYRRTLQEKNRQINYANVLSPHASLQQLFITDDQLRQIYNQLFK